MLYKCNYGFDCILTVVYVDAECVWGSSSRPRTTRHGFPTRVPNSLRPTSSAGTRLSISPNRWVTGIARLRLLSEPALCCIVRTPTVTRAWKHRETKFYTLFIRDATVGNRLGVFFSPPILKREDWEVADWSTDLGLKGCACYRQRWVWSAVLRQPIVHL